ncbi:DUF411 domain-containing protein [Marinobacterium jannaschii]|uniref:DUF411 domain-containing protein n=1 Tax=Marinobacterium jannaschii TaxID=64970 RepID=UPI000488F22C|nr:DUF411 domain-containing protein [Marinobacterium jannaschii]
MKKLVILVALGAAFLPLSSVQAADPFWAEGRNAEVHDIRVYHSPTCGCCKAWISHLKEHNFQVQDIEMNDLSELKRRLGVPKQGASCHTAVVNDKVIEGHVPAQDIKRLLAGKSDTRLLTVPGMPSGGPGMDMPGARKDSFAVYAVSSGNEVSVFNEYQADAEQGYR